MRSGRSRLLICDVITRHCLYLDFKQVLVVQVYALMTDAILKATGIDLQRSSVTPEIIERRQIRDAQKLYEKCAEARSPSKDYYQLMVTEKGVVLRVWKIRRLKHKAPPGEMVASWQDFRRDME